MRSEANANRPMRLGEAGDALGLSVRTIRSWIAKKKLRHIRLGGAIRILPSDIQELYEAPRFPRRSTRRQREWNIDSARAERARARSFVGIALREYALTHPTHSSDIPVTRARA